MNRALALSFIKTIFVYDSGFYWLLMGYLKSGKHDHSDTWTRWRDVDDSYNQHILEPYKKPLLKHRADLIAFLRSIADALEEKPPASKWSDSPVCQCFCDCMAAVPLLNQTCDLCLSNEHKSENSRGENAE